MRQATPEDEPRLALLHEQAIAEQAEGRGGSIWSRREGLRQPQGDPLWLVGTIDDAIVGYVAVGIEALSDESRLGVVSAIYVEAGAREVAVGEALLDEVIAWCTERGCVGIDAHALPGNRATKNFFETFGFTARLLVVHRAL